jgi:hypothetical protein
MTTTESATQDVHEPVFWKYATDIRAVTGVLFVCYGTILTLRGALATVAEIAQAEGVNINLWTGVASLVFAAVCLYCAFARRDQPVG